MPHEHKWGRGYREVDVPVIDGVATMPDGRTIESTANIVRYPEPIDDFVCGVCGATRDTPAEHPQTPGPCIFVGCVSTDRHSHVGFPGGYDNHDDPDGPPIEFTTEPAPGVRDYNGALLELTR